MVKKTAPAANKKKDEIIGAAYTELQEIVKQYAQNDLPVLFIGGTGSGKEMFASLYMESSPRWGKGKMMTTNCAASEEGLLRSEIFGHVKGAFTGAITERAGKVKICNKGILFLDELGDASASFQAALLRISEGNSFTPVGSNEEEKADTVIIAATCKPQSIRDDLKKRFHVLPVPPLHKSDIPCLVKHFMNGRLPSKETLEELIACEYPGNVRELKKMCEKILAERGDRIFLGPKADILPTSNFDYNRYRMEMETWEHFIQPILLEHELGPFFKYEYQPWDDQWMTSKGPGLRDGGITIFDHSRNYIHLTLKESAELIIDGCCPSNLDYQMAAFLESEYGLSMIYVIKMLLEGYHKGVFIMVDPSLRNGGIEPDATPKKFQQLLRNIIESGTLPYLLQKLRAKTLQNQARNDQAPVRPILSNLLDLPVDDAIKRFVAFYGEYNLSRFPDSQDFDKAVGIQRKSMKQRIKRP
jgi:hypothetical protein